VILSSEASLKCRNNATLLAGGQSPYCDRRPFVIRARTEELAVPVNRFGLVRHPAAPQRYSVLIIFERVNGNPCPARVVISTDEFRHIDEATFKPVPRLDRISVSTAAGYVGAFLSGCESSLDY
jgi:hypothetical protein